MKVIIVVDANIIISALLGGSARFILFKDEFQFVTADYTIKEVKKYVELVSEKSGVTKEKILYALSTLPLRIYTTHLYHSKTKIAKTMISKFDPKDVDILALTLQLNTYLWTQDKHFEKIRDKIHVLKTENLI